MACDGAGRKRLPLRLHEFALRYIVRYSAVTMKENIRQVAQRLAIENVLAEPAITRIYLFPSREEIRLVEVDTTMPSQNTVDPYYFGAQPLQNLPYRMAIALVNPNDENHATLPANWGQWQDAEVIYPV